MVLKEYNCDWKRNIDNMVKTLDIKEVQKLSSIDIHKLEPVGTYTFKDFLHAYDLETKSNAKEYLISAQIAVKLMMPYIFRQTSGRLFSQRDEILDDIYLELVKACKRLDFAKMDENNISLMQNQCAGYFKLYCKGIISDYVREHISEKNYDNGIRLAPFSELFLNVSYNRDEIDYQYGLDKLGYYTTNPVLKDNSFKDKQTVCILFAYKHNMKFGKVALKKEINFGNVGAKRKILCSENEKNVDKLKRITVHKNNATRAFIYDFVLKLDEKGLDIFIDTFNIPYNKKSFQFDYEQQESVWEILMRKRDNRIYKGYGYFEKDEKEIDKEDYEPPILE